jgi:hypothetical protein
MFPMKIVEKIETHILCSITFLKIVPFMRKREKKCCEAGQVIDENMAHAHCMLDTLGYKHILKSCNTYCFSTATVVAWTRLSITLYVHYPSCYRHLKFFL